jgi:hypothetical protein
MTQIRGTYNEKTINTAHYLLGRSHSTDTFDSFARRLPNLHTTVMKYAKLPKWAQEDIKRLEAQIAEKDRQIAWLKATPDESQMYYELDAHKPETCYPLISTQLREAAHLQDTLDGLLGDVVIYFVKPKDASYEDPPRWLDGASIGRWSISTYRSQSGLPEKLFWQFHTLYRNLQILILQVEEIGNRRYKEGFQNGRKELLAIIEGEVKFDRETQVDVGRTEESLRATVKTMRMALTNFINRTCRKTGKPIEVGHHLAFYYKGELGGYGRMDWSLTQVIPNFTNWTDKHLPHGNYLSTDYEYEIIEQSELPKRN